VYEVKVIEEGKEKEGKLKELLCKAIDKINGEVLSW